MSKSIFVIALLFTFPIVASESFSLLSGDMIDQNFQNDDDVFPNHHSNIINFNEPTNEQQLKNKREYRKMKK